MENIESSWNILMDINFKINIHQKDRYTKPYPGYSFKKKLNKILNIKRKLVNVTLTV